MWHGFLTVLVPRNWDNVKTLLPFNDGVGWLSESDGSDEQSRAAVCKEGTAEMAVPLLYGISKALVDRPGYWPASVQLTGFWTSQVIACFPPPQETRPFPVSAHWKACPCPMRHFSSTNPPFSCTCSLKIF